MQINNEDLYLLYIYIDVYAESEKELEIQLNSVEGMLQSNGIQTKRANFRQEQVFFSCTPLMQNSYDIKYASKRNILTSGLVGTYPFISSSIFDEEGVFIGNNIYNNSLIFIDKFDREKYKILPRRVTGTCAKHQRVVAEEVKKARHMALIPYVG